MNLTRMTNFRWSLTKTRRLADAYPDFQSVKTKPTGFSRSVVYFTCAGFLLGTAGACVLDVAQRLLHNKLDRKEG